MALLIQLPAQPVHVFFIQGTLYGTATKVVLVKLRPYERLVFLVTMCVSIDFLQRCSSGYILAVPVQNLPAITIMLHSDVDTDIRKACRLQSMAVNNST